MPGLAGDKNVVLIGMPAVGKSTIGVLLAKAMSRHFIDTDVLVQGREGRHIQDMIDTDGVAAFRRIEERDVLALECRGHVIATGGSVVYSPAAMGRLKKSGVAVLLDLSLPLIEKRLTDLDSRGVVREPGQTIASLFEERKPLYERYADITIDCEGLTHEQTVARIMDALNAVSSPDDSVV